MVAIRKHLGFEVAIDCLNGVSAAIRDALEQETDQAAIDRCRHHLTEASRR